MPSSFTHFSSTNVGALRLHEWLRSLQYHKRRWSALPLILCYCNFAFAVFWLTNEYVEDFFFRNLKPQGIGILPWYMTSLLTHQDGLFISILFPLTSVWAVMAVALIVCFQNSDSFSERRSTSSPSYCSDTTLLPSVSVTLIDKSIELILSSVLNPKPR